MSPATTRSLSATENGSGPKRGRTMNLQLTLNGEAVSRDVDPCARLIDVLRDELGTKGVKEGCGEGECGACTILLDDAPVNACLVLAAQADECRITTVEGLSTNGELHPVQRAFADAGAVQCGFCTPGMVISTKALLDRNPDPTEEEIRDALSGNLCRCTGYGQIVSAVQLAAERLKRSISSPASPRCGDGHEPAPAEPLRVSGEVPRGGEGE